jgi:hypothetical protein
MPRKRGNDPTTRNSHTVEIEFGGRTVSGFYRVKRGLISVSTSQGSKATQVGGSPPESLARVMLRELAKEGKA